jgi:hypothetical protein
MQVAIWNLKFTKIWTFGGRTSCIIRQLSRAAKNMEDSRTLDNPGLEFQPFQS